MKVDDDVHVFLPALEKQLLDNTEEEFYGCAGELIVGSIPKRDPKGRSHVTISQYSEAEYPDYCGGMMYVLGR